MADVKISQLPSATTPLAGTEQVPLVQSGVTKKATVADITANKIDTLTSTDGSVTVSGTGTSRNLSVTYTTDVVVLVRNNTGATLTKGTVVYITGATGQTPTISKALASGDATSAQTLGMVRENIANNSTGYIVTTGLITNIDTSAYTDGAQLYLSGVTAGTVTTTKPYAPLHLVYVGIVEYANASNGKIFVNVQNGYELDELHNVSAQTPSNGDTIVYNSSTSLWESSKVGLTTSVSGTLSVGNGGTGAATFTANNVLLGNGTSALQTVAPGTNGNVLTSNGTTWTSATPSANVTSISFGSTGLTPSTATTGAVSVAGTLSVGNGGTGATTLTANNVLLGNGTSALQVVAPGTNGNVLTSNGTTWQSSTPAAQAYPAAGIAVSTGSAWTTSKTSPSGTIVGTTDSQTLTSKTIEAGTFTNGYTEETYTANSSTAITLDLANGSFQIITLTGSATITMPTAVAGKSFILLLKSGAGSYTVTWSTVAWPSGTAPTLTSTASKQDILSFFSDGVKWYGTTVGLNYTP